MKKVFRPGASLFLGIECGGTSTSAVLADATGRILRAVKAGPANLRLISDAQLIRHFRQVASDLPPPASIAIGMAGVRTENDQDRIRRAAGRVWRRVPCFACNDLETALAAVEDHGPTPSMTQVLVLSGTGSCCFGRTPDGRTAKIGGWGHILGDKGSGHEIGLRALKAAVYYYDRDGVWSSLGQRILRALQLNEPNDLVAWVQTATKTEVASLAVEVFEAWKQRDKIASDILASAAQSLADDAVSCAKRLVKAGSSVHFIYNGSVLLKQPRFARQVSRLLRELWPAAIITRLKRDSAWGAVELARRHYDRLIAPFLCTNTAGLLGITSGGREEAQPFTTDIPSPASIDQLQLSPTEQRNPRSRNLHRLSPGRAIELMLSEDGKIPGAIHKERTRIERAVVLIARAFRRGGRLFYVGAGTSGRLGILDASECPPTFSVPPEQVQGIIAGGQRAIWASIESAEDDPSAGARAIDFRGIDRRDVVVGIAASGRTPFVWGALWEAKKRGAATILLCFNPAMNIPPRDRPGLIIAPKIGPEILTGSTRLKAGTATKLILNIFTTLAMVRTGKVVSNLMIDLNPSNIKLRDRAVRIVRELTGVDEPTAKRALEQSRWIVQAAWQKLSRKRREKPVQSASLPRKKERAVK